jgi:hypothetical protein
MFQIFGEEPLVTAGIFGFMGISLFMQILLSFLYRKMIRETDNMAATNNKLLKQCKLKFANCYQLNNGVANIPVFVDKFLSRLALGPFSFETIYHLSGQSMLLSVICAGIGVCRAVAGGRTLGEILPFYIVSFLGIYLYFAVSSMADVRGKKRILKVNLVDYLENHLSARMEVTEGDMEMLYGETLSGRNRNMRLGTGGGRNRNGANRTGRRTVELMPIGNRGSMGMERAENNIPETREDVSREMPLGSFLISDEELESLIKEFC